MRSYRLVVLVLIIVGFVFAQDKTNPDSLYGQGNRLMLAEQYLLAIDTYENIIELGHEHADLYYNLGNAHFRTNQLGNAVWSYEKGLQLSPRDSDLKFNLSLVNTRIRDRIEMPETVLLLEEYRAIKKSTTLMDILLIGATVVMLGAFIYFMKRYYRWRSIWLSRLVITLFVLSVFVHLMALDKYFELSNKNEGVIVQPEIEVFSAPFDRKETVIFRLHEGVKAEITQNQQNWLEIELIDGKKGWIQSEKVRLL